jgi:hypothetical protein
MPVLTIVVENLPERCPRLALQTKGGYVESDNLRFSVPYELRADRSGVVQPTGDAVQRQPDGRRFVYLAWLSGDTMVGRIKVQFDGLTPEQVAEGATVVVSATDRRGNPAGGSVVFRVAPTQP